MCGRFYVDDETAREIEKIAGKIDRKMEKMGDVHPSEPALILRALKGEMVSEVLKWGYDAAGKNILMHAQSRCRKDRCSVIIMKTDAVSYQRKSFMNGKRSMQSRRRNMISFHRGKPYFWLGSTIKTRMATGSRF